MRYVWFYDIEAILSKGYTGEESDKTEPVAGVGKEEPVGLRDMTKRLFASAIEEMMETVPLEKIRVKDLCIRCSTDRQSFYYHFRDKYDLIAWIYARDYEDVLVSTGGEYSLDHAADILRHLWEKRAFYRKAFTDKSQNAISAYIYQYYLDLGTKAVRDRLGEEALTPEAVYDIKSHAYACLGHTVKWLEGRESYTPEEFARFQYRSMPLVLKRGYGIPEDAGFEKEALKRHS